MKKLGTHLTNNGEIYGHLLMLGVMVIIMTVAMWPLMKYGIQLEDEGVGKTTPKYII